MLLHSDADLALKIEAVSAYATQMSTVFGSGPDPAARIRTHAFRVGDGRPAERIWTR